MVQDLCRDERLLVVVAGFFTHGHITGLTLDPVRLKACPVSPYFFYSAIPMCNVHHAYPAVPPGWVAATLYNERPPPRFHALVTPRPLCYHPS